MTYSQHMRAQAARYLAKLVIKHDGDVVAAGIEAGVTRGAFYRLLRRHGVQPMRRRVRMEKGNAAWRAMGH